MSTPTAVSRLADGLHLCNDIAGRVLASQDAVPYGSTLRVAVLYREATGWAALAAFMRMFTRSLDLVAKERNLELGILAPRDESGKHAVPQHLPGRRWFMLPASGGRGALEASAAHHDIHVVIELFGTPPQIPGVGVVSWITDFQHLHLPQFFTTQEYKDREENFQQRAQNSNFILLSSQAAKTDYDATLSHASEKAWVAPFPSSLVFEELPSGEPRDIVRQYHLPEKFLLVANQYWAHKNHGVVIEALGKLAAEGVRIPAVFTGLPSDYRDPSNAPTSRILQSIAQQGLAGQVVPLGQVPFAHLQQLMRCAALVIQPSRFEGWSTVVQDIKALGRPLMCSDLPVHREQAPMALGHFGCDAPEALATYLRSHWPHLAAGPDLAQESRSLAAERAFAHTYGLRLADLCRRAFEVATTRRPA
ncbi:glycosyltransferase involved in cell wall biosynthesis [Roseimicrobium gellanilyticum]|uniref:Glycosyltransferase involved in cell wall biosynthesis n=1 Tax=Roseimicrobium gellanilyticum TaxID=748857 RepID=A0A366H3V4_9BACT|nr:glycosyltransferase [Roseimicrobium gellanilyticum]RBP36671.1 glycosyltransferase involved in cell wall biosynthesis [Roseimicrobium gellanilyticum]